MTTPKVSVILTNFNHEKYIEQAFRSVVLQTYTDIELIVVDDCSTDNSKDVINKLVGTHSKDLPIKTVFLGENKGKWNALNRGIEVATGTLIALQDADDYSLSNRIEKQVELMKKLNSFHSLCGFWNITPDEFDSLPEFIQEFERVNKLAPLPLAYMDHYDVLRAVHRGFNTPGINHYYTGDFETHGASSIFHRSLWANGLKFTPGGMGLRVQKAEDGDHNTKLTLLLQKTSVLKEQLYLYRRGTSTNGAWLEEK